MRTAIITDSNSGIFEQEGWSMGVFVIPMPVILDGSAYVVDNHRISVTLRHAVQDAVFLREQGCSAKKIQEMLETAAYESIVYAGVGTLRYLKASGRVTPAGAAIGTILNIKPLLVIEGGRLDAYAKGRGTKACQQRLIRVMQDQVQRLSEDGSILQIGVAGSFSDSVKAVEWEAMAKEAFPEYTVQYDPLTFSIACHVGLDAFGMGISKKITRKKGENLL